MKNLIFNALTDIDENLVTEAYEYSFRKNLCINRIFNMKPAYTMAVSIWLVGIVLGVQNYFGNI